MAGFAASAGAAPVTQEGLVNVNATDVTIQVPIGIAANICDVNVAVLTGVFLDSADDCIADEQSTATVERGDSGPTTQRGLVNVNLDDVAIQLPIGIVANICDVNVAVLTQGILDDSAPCEATGLSVSEITG